MPSDGFADKPLMSQAGIHICCSQHLWTFSENIEYCSDSAHVKSDKPVNQICHTSPLRLSMRFTKLKPKSI